jgi:hypothetical protein
VTNGVHRREAPPARRALGCDYGAVSVVARLVTFVDLRDGGGGVHEISVSARLEAELVDGRRLLLLDDRGWSASVRGTSWADASPEEQPDAWATMSIAEIEETARVVVGPDEPIDGSSPEEADARHLAHLSELLRRHGVAVEPSELMRLDHDVMLGEELLARVRRDSDRFGSG